MTPLQAEEILNKYWNSIKDLRPNAIVQPTSDLPYISAKIKQAHFVLGEELIKNGIMTKEFAETLMESYGIIDSLFIEDPEPINKKYREYIAGLKKGIITDFRMPNPFGECIPVLEYANFVGELLFSLGKPALITNDPVPLGAYVYDALRTKAQKDNDLNLCIEIVNTSLTRAVHYPGKKNNAESVFVKLD